MLQGANTDLFNPFVLTIVSDKFYCILYKLSQFAIVASKASFRQ